jgi:striatin 1/3/4
MGIRQEKERDKSKGYLVKCTSEVSYHVLPSSHVPPDVSDPLPANNNVTQYGQPTQQELHDAYIQLKRQKQERYNNDIQMVRENVIPSNQQQHMVQDEPSPLQRTNTQIHHSQLAIREQERKSQDRSPQPMTAAELRKPPYYDQPPPDEPVESVSHSFDAYGRQVQPGNESQPSVTETKVDITDGWDFDDSPPEQHIPNDPPPPHRPDMEVFPSANQLASKSPPRGPPGSRRKSSGARRRSENDIRDLASNPKIDNTQFKVRFAMRGHLDVVRSVIFTGGGSPSEPEFCTGSDDGGVKRWHIPASYAHNSVAIGEDLDRIAHFTHRGHVGAVTSLAACPASPHFSNGGRASGEGWIFSGGEDTTVRIWERGRVDSKAILEGHRDAVWALCILPGTSGSIFGERCSSFGGPDRILLAAGGADGTILIWAVSQPPQASSPHGGSTRGARGSRRANSVSAGSNFPSSPQPSVASNTIFNYTLVHRIERPNSQAPTSISPLSPGGESFVVSYADASVLVFDTRTGEEVVGMASQETYDGTPDTAVNAIVATSSGFDTAASVSPGRRGSIGEDDVVHGATGSEGGVEGVVIAGYEDKYIRFFDANSGMSHFSPFAESY